MGFCLRFEYHFFVGFSAEVEEVEWDRWRGLLSGTWEWKVGERGRNVGEEEAEETVKLRGDSGVGGRVVKESLERSGACLEGWGFGF